MTTKQILKAAMALLDSHFATHGLAYDKEGNEVHPRSKKAVEFCAIGAIHRVAPKGTRSYKTLYRLLRNQATALYRDDVADFYSDTRVITDLNDWAGKRAIIRVFKEAIKHA